jgi:hypothetical protein
VEAFARPRPELRSAAGARDRAAPSRAPLTAGQAAKEAEEAVARVEKAICKSWKEAEQAGGAVPAWAAQCR